MIDGERRTRTRHSSEGIFCRVHGCVGSRKDLHCEQEKREGEEGTRPVLGSSSRVRRDLLRECDHGFEP